MKFQVRYEAFTTVKPCTAYVYAYIDANEAGPWGNTLLNVMANKGVIVANYGLAGGHYSVYITELHEDDWDKLKEQVRNTIDKFKELFHYYKQHVEKIMKEKPAHELIE